MTMTGKEKPAFGKIPHHYHQQSNRGGAHTPRTSLTTNRYPHKQNQMILSFSKPYFCIRERYTKRFYLAIYNKPKDSI